MGVEGPFVFEALLLCLRLSEAVAFFWEGHIGDWEVTGSQGVDHSLCLAGGHDAVFKPLEENDWAGELCGVVDWGALLIDRLGCGVGGDESVGVARFEFMRICGECL